MTGWVSGAVSDRLGGRGCLLQAVCFFFFFSEMSVLTQLREAQFYHEILRDIFFSAQATKSFSLVVFMVTLLYEAALGIHCMRLMLWAYRGIMI